MSEPAEQASNANARAHELATLAARVCPDVCQQEPGRAIEIAMALLTAAHEAIGSSYDDPRQSLAAMEVDLRCSFEERDAELKPYKSFEPGVKFITGENRFDRALLRFRKFMRSLSSTEKVCEAAITKLRAEDFTSDQLDTLRADFVGWNAKDKSEEGRSKRAKRAAKEAEKAKVAKENKATEKNSV